MPWWRHTRPHRCFFAGQRRAVAAKSGEDVGCFQSSEGFSQVIRAERPRLILLLFGGIPNSPTKVVLTEC
jgi:hypothetical protein